MGPEEKPRQGHCITKGKTSADISRCLRIFRKHIFIFNLHQSWSRAKSLQSVSLVHFRPGWDSLYGQTDTVSDAIPWVGYPKKTVWICFLWIPNFLLHSKWSGFLLFQWKIEHWRKKQRKEKAEWERKELERAINRSSPFLGFLLFISIGHWRHKLCALKTLQGWASLAPFSKENSDPSMMGWGLTGGVYTRLSNY